jgi:uncharacterized membrane protein
MRIWIANLWEDLRTSYWFVPSLMCLLAVGLAILTLYVDDHNRFRWVTALGWVYTGGAEGARSLLSTVASSIVTVAGVVFSITIVALTLASSQFGPRLLRNFMRDLGNQITLGTFTATFLYCLLILRTVRTDSEGAPFVPHVSVTTAIALTIASIGVLIYFIHHVSASIQAPYVVAAVSHDLCAVMDDLFPEAIGRDADAVEQPPPAGADRFEDPDVPATDIPSPRAGYIQAVDPDAVLAIARDHDLVVQILHRPGQFVVTGQSLARTLPASPDGPRVSAPGRPDPSAPEDRDEIPHRIAGAFIFGNRRTITQDAEFAVDQLVEIAVRALSPGINDPFTALNCIDRLGEALSRLADRKVPSPYRLDPDTGQLRVIAYPVGFAQMADAAFNQIRQYGRSSAAVTLRLLETVAVVADRCRRPADRAALRRHAAMIERDARELLADDQDRHDLLARFRDALQASAEEPADRPSAASDA